MSIDGKSWEPKFWIDLKRFHRAVVIIAIRDSLSNSCSNGQNAIAFDFYDSNDCCFSLTKYFFLFLILRWQLSLELNESLSVEHTRVEMLSCNMKTGISFSAVVHVDLQLFEFFINDTLNTTLNQLMVRSVVLTPETFLILLGKRLLCRRHGHHRKGLLTNPFHRFLLAIGTATDKTCNKWVLWLFLQHCGLRKRTMNVKHKIMQ